LHDYGDGVVGVGHAPVSAMNEMLRIKVAICLLFVLEAIGMVEMLKLVLHR
jgi:hypothetical protein